MRKIYNILGPVMSFIIFFYFLFVLIVSLPITGEFMRQKQNETLAWLVSKIFYDLNFIYIIICSAYFFYGMILLLFKQKTVKEKNKGKTYLLRGLLGFLLLFLCISLLKLISFFTFKPIGTSLPDISN